VAIDTNLRIDLAGIDLLKAKARIILSSFKTAAETGLDFPEGTNFNAPEWQSLTTMESCPVCGMKSTQEDLKKYGCPWCGWNYRQKES
jgi:rubredoxin